MDLALQPLRTGQTKGVQINEKQVDDSVGDSLALLLGELFGHRIVSLLYYGSNCFNKTKSRYSDYDFCLVLDRYRPDDLLRVRGVTRQSQGIDMTIHYLDDLEKMGWSDFQHGSHGTFFLLHLAAAKTLVGVNIFERKLTLVHREKISTSLKSQIVEYFWRLDHYYLSNMAESVLSTKYRKYLIRIAQDMLLLKGDISFSEINTVTHEQVVEQFIIKSGCFSDRTKWIFERLTDRSISIDQLAGLKRHLYEDFRSIQLQ